MRDVFRGARNTILNATESEGFVDSAPLCLCERAGDCVKGTDVLLLK